MPRNNKIKIISLSIVIVLLFSFIINYYNSNNSFLIQSNRSINNEDTLSMLLETATEGVYEKSNSNTWPTTGYIFNETLSGCENGGTLSWDTTNNKVIFNGRSTDKCYVYFDIDGYIVSYNANGGTGTMNPTINEVVENTFTAPTNSGFKEWNTSADGTGTTYTTSSEVTSNLTLYAIWGPVYKYWNDNRSRTTYQKNAVPTGSGLNGTYASREAFASAYSSFESDPRYIRTVLIDGNVVGHEACLYYNNREFCIGPNYWAGTINTQDATVGTNTKIKLQRDMEAALGTTASSCSSTAGAAYCYFGSFICYANFYGDVYCDGVASCYVKSDGSAHCR